MRSGFILSCESTIDLPYSYCEQRDIPVLFYSYQVDGVSYEDDMGRDPEALPQFYGFLDAGKLPSTAQLNEFQYETFFDALLQQGDVLHIAFGSGMTASVQNAMLAAETLREKYPDLPEALFQTGQSAEIGRKLLEDRNGVITEYGLIRRLDGQPVQSLHEAPEQNGMEMI